MATPWPRDERINVYIFNRPGCRWRAAPGISSRQRGATDRQAMLAPISEAGALLAGRRPSGKRHDGTGLRAFSGKWLSWFQRGCVQCPAQFKRRLAVAGCALAPSGWLVVAGSLPLPPARLFRRRARDLAAPLPLLVQRPRHSRNRAGLTGTAGGFQFLHQLAAAPAFAMQGQQPFAQRFQHVNGGFAFLWRLALAPTVPVSLSSAA